MKFVFKNLGPIHEAELELGDLTIIAGRNNTGKTYVAYTLYGFLKMWKEVPLFVKNLDKLSRSPQTFTDLAMEWFPDLERIAKRVVEEGQTKWSVDREKVNEQRQSIIRESAQSFSGGALANGFGSSHEDFEGASIEAVIENEFPEYESSKTLSFSTGEKLTLTYNYDEVHISRSKETGKPLSADAILSNPLHLYLSLLFPEFPEPFILCAERFSISLFYKELDFTKNRLVETLQTIIKKSERDVSLPFLVIDRMASQYTRPIQDNIDYTRDIPYLRKHRSELSGSKLFNGIRDMMGGSYTASDDDIRFKSKARKGGFDIPLHLASSSVRGLSDLYFFLRHKAQKNQLLIIDEPESHLDTAHQIQFARLLARAIHAGLKVLITTHSDYIVKEINNLLMLSKDFKNKPKVLKEHGYSEHDFLKPESVRAYAAEKHSLTRCTIDRFGIDMPVFEKTIDAINRVSSELESRLTYEGEE